MTEEKYIFDFKNYRQYLIAKVGPRDRRTGMKSKIAEVLNVQPGYISQVLYGHLQLSLEHAEILNEFFNHTKEEAHYFLLLVQKDRAGSARLKKYFEEQLKGISSKRLNIVARMGTQNVLSANEQNTYYSSWHYAAIHIALTIPDLQSIDSLSDFFRIPKKKVKAVVGFLIEVGLAVNTKGRLVSGSNHVRLGNNSVNIIRHHTNLRQMAIDALDREELEDLHYSSVVSLSRSDVTQVKEVLLRAIEENLQIIKPSKEEELYGLNLDFFNLKRS